VAQVPRGLTITIFLDVKFGNGNMFKMCVSDSDPTFSRRRFATKNEATLACWVDELAPRFGLTPYGNQVREIPTTSRTLRLWRRSSASGRPALLRR
jgi:hypothetical protein